MNNNLSIENIKLVTLNERHRFLINLNTQRFLLFAPPIQLEGYIPKESIGYFLNNTAHITAHELYKFCS